MMHTGRTEVFLLAQYTNCFSFLILIYNIFNTLSALITFRILPLSHRIKKYIHATLNIVAAVFALIGLAAVLQFHNENGIPNFYSLHSWCGISLISLLLLQVGCRRVAVVSQGGVQQQYPLIRLQITRQQLDRNSINPG